VVDELRPLQSGHLYTPRVRNKNPDLCLRHGIHALSGQWRHLNLKVMGSET